jgi:polyhydroxyalkanoate synthesis repressor PhaR
MDSEVRLIKKYPNRRLYDTGESCYIKLTEVRQMIEQGIPIKVIDSQTKEDITRSILLQIIYEQEANQDPLFSTENLENFIRYYGGNTREGFMYFMDKNLQFFQDQQEQMQENLENFMDSNSLDFWASLTRKNVDIWQEMQESFLRSSGFAPNSDARKKNNT